MESKTTIVDMTIEREKSKTIIVDMTIEWERIYESLSNNIDFKNLCKFYYEYLQVFGQITFNPKVPMCVAWSSTLEKSNDEDKEINKMFEKSIKEYRPLEKSVFLDSCIMLLYNQWFLLI